MANRLKHSVMRFSTEIELVRNLAVNVKLYRQAYCIGPNTIGGRDGDLLRYFDGQRKRRHGVFVRLRSPRDRHRHQCTGGRRAAPPLSRRVRPQTHQLSRVGSSSAIALTTQRFVVTSFLELSVRVSPSKEPSSAKYFRRCALSSLRQKRS